MLTNIKNIYFSGINGIGMSGLAKILKKQGYNISGSDIEKKEVTFDLEKMGIDIFIGQKEENVKGKEIDLFIYSTAIKENNPEYAYIKEKNIKMLRRGELLASIMNKFNKSIAVAGTHGKTTTSSMMSVAFLSKDPYIMVGGIIPEIKNNSKIGNSDYFIAEADESDNSFLHLTPEYSIVTNIEEDHLEFHGNLENIKESFEKFISQTSKKVVLCYDCSNIKKLDLKNEKNEKIVWYSSEPEKYTEEERLKINIYAENIYVKDGISYFTVIKEGKNLGEFKLSIPGKHNISNSLAVIFIASEENCDLKNVAEMLFNFKGANRRYQILYDKSVKIIDDYAHHPTEIEATIKAAKSNEKGNVSVIFQPHRYSRTKFFLNDFAKSLSLADEVFVLPIYSANEENIYDVSSEDLVKLINTYNNSDKKVLACDIEKVYKIIEEKLVDGGNYIFMGAGTVSKYGHDMVEKIGNGVLK